MPRSSIPLRLQSINSGILLVACPTGRGACPEELLLLLLLLRRMEERGALVGSSPHPTSPADQGEGCWGVPAAAHP
jgi:hypothetical protein